LSDATAPVGFSLPRLSDHTQTLHTGRVRSPDAGTSQPHNTQHSKETGIHAPSVGFEPTVPESKRPQAHALEPAATGIGTSGHTGLYIG